MHIQNAFGSLPLSWQRLLMVLLVTTTGFSVSIATPPRPLSPPLPIAAQSQPAALDNSIAVSGTITLSLPLIMVNYPRQTVFGVQMGGVSNSAGLQQVATTPSTWVRSGNPVQWSDVEPVEGAYQWPALAGLEQEWIRASKNNLLDFVMVRSTPAWAQAQPGHTCGPVRSDKLVAFGQFMHALVARYSPLPYGVKYWEIGNEPDIDPALVPLDSNIGCWGNAHDTYYGGGYYAEMLKVVYPQIKLADPSAQVLVGGLLLDCDPNNPPPGKGDCRPARFLEGVLKQGGGSYFDGVGIHGYDAYVGALGAYKMPNWNTSSTSTSGPTMAFVAKANYVRGLLAAYGVTGKFVANDESALGWGVATANATFETTKAYYVAEVYATALAEHMLANIWYSMDDDWHHQALLGPGLTPRPAWFAYQFASQQLADAKFSQAITSYPGVKGYAFNRISDSVWLLWSQDGAVHNLALPGLPVAIHHVDGTVLTATTTLALGPEPLYIQWQH